MWVDLVSLALLSRYLLRLSRLALDPVAWKTTMMILDVFVVLL
jgi:hypothetical protein